MADIYKLKVYHNTTTNFSTATYLQDTFVTLGITDPAISSTTTLVNGSGATTGAYQSYLDAGCFEGAYPYLYDSSAANIDALIQVGNYFSKNLVMGIDLKNILTSSQKYLFLSTDNSPYYFRLTFQGGYRNSQLNSIVVTDTSLYNKSNNTGVIGASSCMGYMDCVDYTDTYPNVLYLYHNPKTTYRLSSKAGQVKMRVQVGGSNFNTFYSTLLVNDSPYIPTTDPYDGAGDSDTGGGDGTFDGSSDPVPVPSLPSIGATDTGFISLFVPSASQIRQVASYLWSNFFDLATFKKLFEDPMDCILGLSVVPVSVPISGSAQITVGNIELSGISLPLASQQYVEVDCGTVDFTDRFFGSYLDFEPYTKMSLFVPYSGVHAVSADDIIGKVVGLKYHIDILTGSLVAFLTCGNSVLYEFNGACASNIPVNSMNYASTIENAIRIAVNIGTTVATAGAAAPATGAVEAGKVASGAAGLGRGIAIAGSTAEGALSLKPSIDRAGSLGGTTGLMGNQIPYFIITRPRMCKPKNQDVFQGYPSFIQTTLGDMEGTGFTAFENVILAGSYLTDAEKSELISILSAGVYL